MLFTGCVTNGRGAEEQPENYIIRHTQLLPRHLLTLLNGIVANHLSGKGDCLGIPPDSVIAGVREKEEYLAQDVLTPYTWVYPNLVSAMRPVLSELGHCFDFGELDKRLPRIVRDSGEDFDLHNRAQIWLLLHGMGVIGLQNGVDEKRSYVESIFHYNTLDAKKNFVVNSKSRYCFHPLFSRSLGLAGPSNSAYCVFPAGVQSLGEDG